MSCPQLFDVYKADKRNMAEHSSFSGHVHFAISRDAVLQTSSYSLLGNNGAFRPDLNNSNISSPIQTFLDLAIPPSISAIRSA